MSIFTEGPFSHGYAWRVYDDGGYTLYTNGDVKRGITFISRASHLGYDSLKELYWREPLIFFHDRLWECSPCIASYASPLFNATQVLLENKGKVAIVGLGALASYCFFA